MEKIILLGFGGHCKSIIDSIESLNEYSIVGVLDVKEKYGQRYRDYEVIGDDDMLQQLYICGVTHAFVSVGYLGENTVRERLFSKVKKMGFTVPTIIDKTAILADDSIIGEGTFIGKGAIINSNVKIGEMAIINTGAIIEHDCIIGDYAHISVGSVLCGAVKVGKSAFVGARTVVKQGLTIGEKVLIGMGSSVISDVDDNVKIYGLIKRRN